MSNREPYVQSIASRDLGRIDRITAGKKELRKLAEVLDTEERIEALLGGQLGRGLSKENGAIAITERRVLFASRNESQDWPFPAISYAEHRGSWSNQELKLLLADGGETTLTGVTPADRVEQAAGIITERAAGSRQTENAGQPGAANVQTAASPPDSAVGKAPTGPPWPPAPGRVEQPPEGGVAAEYAEEARRITDLTDADGALEAVYKEHRSRIEATAGS